MTNRIINTVSHAQCKKCALWFPISKELQELIQDSIINAVDVNLCPVCGEQEADEAELEHELNYMIVF
jgi:hypothetical protein